MEYPDSVLTKGKKSRIEVRSLIDRGEFVRYEYLDPKQLEGAKHLRSAGKRSENKIKLVLKTNKGTEEYFMIPLKQKGKFLLMVTATAGRPQIPKSLATSIGSVVNRFKPKKIWDGKKAVDLFTKLTYKLLFKLFITYLL